MAGEFTARQAGGGSHLGAIFGTGSQEIEDRADESADDPADGCQCSPYRAGDFGELASLPLALMECPKIAFEGGAV